MAQLSDCDRALIHLQSAYRTELDALQVEAYRRGLADLDGSVLREVVDRVIKAREFFPAIAVLREEAAIVLQDRRNQQLGIGPAPEMWTMSDEDHAELLRQMAAAKARIFAKAMNVMTRTRAARRTPA